MTVADFIVLLLRSSCCWLHCGGCFCIENLLLPLQAPYLVHRGGREDVGDGRLMQVPSTGPLEEYIETKPGPPCFCLVPEH